MVSLDLIPERVLVFLNSLLGQITWLRTLLPKDFNIDDTYILVAGVLRGSELLLMCVHFCVSYKEANGDYRLLKRIGRNVSIVKG